MTISYDERRICSYIAFHKTRGKDLPAILDLNSRRKAPFAVADIERLYPVGCALTENAKLLTERLHAMRALVEAGKPIPPEMDCRLCDLPGIVRPTEQG